MSDSHARQVIQPSSAILTELGETMRYIGFFFLLLATGALAWDAYSILAGHGVRSLSGIMQIWTALHETSFHRLENAAMGSLGYDVWTYMLVPLLSLPAFALFGLPGLLMLRVQNHEIKARAPSLIELELMRQGMDPRKNRR